MLLVILVWQFVPATCVFGSSWTDWHRIFARTKPNESTDHMIYLSAYGAVIGVWFGTWPMALDWESPWQVCYLIAKDSSCCDKEAIEPIWKISLSWLSAWLENVLLSNAPTKLPDVLDDEFGNTRHSKTLGIIDRASNDSKVDPATPPPETLRVEYEDAKSSLS
ncbi:hypothetical protein CQW23_28659 [Capsicum baccatum]|uniref:Uncharacterized protein n=1 Tax=Capsicum baccatum TaxID=33114 RepID=A0A2G2VH76_CAPBA|nr:hypothetical protein CQW23_28659 [Capsicum baccatum]